MRGYELLPTISMILGALLSDRTFRTFRIICAMLSSFGGTYDFLLDDQNDITCYLQPLIADDRRDWFSMCVSQILKLRLQRAHRNREFLRHVNDISYPAGIHDIWAGSRISLQDKDKITCGNIAIATGRAQ